MQAKNKSKSIVAVAAAAASMLMLSPTAKAVNYTWQQISAGNASGSWAVPTNWNPNLPAGGTTVADTALFNALDITGNSTVTLDAPQAIANLIFGDTNPSSSGTWTLNASTSNPSDATNVINFVPGTPTINVGDVFSPQTSVTINARLSNGSVASPTWGLAKGGQGSLTLTANNSTLTGVIFINNGTLNLDFNHAWSPTANIIGDNGTGSTELFLQGGTLNMIGAAGATNSQTFSAGTIAAIGTSEVTFNQNGATAINLNMGALTRPTIAGAGGTQKSAGASVDVVLPTAGSVAATSAQVGPGGLITDPNGTAYVTVNHGADWAAISGANIVAGNSVAGFYTPSTATTLAGNVNLVTNTTLAAPATIATLRQNDAAAHTVELGGPNNLVTGGILVTPTSGALTIQNGNIVAPDVAAADMVISQNNTTSPTTISAAIINNSSNSGLLKTGAGTLILNGANTYSGDTIVNGGTLSVTGGTLGIVGAPFSCTQIAPAFGNSATMNISGTAVVSDDHFDIAGNETNIAGGTGVVNQTGGAIVNGAWFSVGSFGSGTYNMSGGTNTVIGGFASFEVGVFGTSTGLVNISGNSAILMENGSNIRFGSVNTSGNGTINQNGGTVTSYSDAGITTGGGAVILGAGGTGVYTYNLNAGTLTTAVIQRNTGTGNFNFNGGTLKVAANSTGFIGNLTNANIMAGGAIIDTNGFNATVNQPLLHAASLGATPDGGLTKNGAGVLTMTIPSLAAPSTYTGPTIINAGTLRLPSSAVTVPVPVGSYSFENPLGGIANGATVVNTGSGGAALNGTVNTLDEGVNGASIVAGKFGNALELDGGGTSVDIPSQIIDQSGNASWTLAAWIKTSTPGSSILSKNNGGNTFNTNNSTYYLGTSPGPGVPGPLPTAVQNSGGFLQGNTPVADGTYHLLTYVDTNGTRAIYVDGVATTLNALGLTNVDSSNFVRLGYDSDAFSAGDGPVNFAGDLDEVKFYSTALNQQQIQELVNNNVVATGTSAGGGQILPATTAVSITASGATLDLNGTNQIVGSLTGVSGSLVTLGAGTLNAGGDNSSTSFAGNISGTGGITKAGSGTWTLSGTNNYSGPTTVSGGVLSVTTSSALPTGTNLTVGAGATASAALHSGGSANKVVLTLNSLTLDPTGKLDLNNNDMILHNGNQTTVRTLLKQAYNGGNWNGAGGITSSAAASSSSPKTALGYASIAGTFDGQTVTTTDVVVKYTLVGDTDLNGSVAFTDLLTLAQHYQGTNTLWTTGDFNYDGSTNFTDLLGLAQNYQKTAPTLTASQISQLDAAGGSNFAASFAQAEAQAAVPEPGTLSLLGIGAVGLATRRRRRN